MNNHITTATGEQFYFDKPTFDIKDIAWALRNICRYNGHCTSRWSVLQHSVACALVVPPEYQREALLHDATEAYLCDIPTPLKDILPDYKALESSIDKALRKQFELPETMSAVVRFVDHNMLIAETYCVHRPLWREMGSITPSSYAALAFRTVRMMTDTTLVQTFFAMSSKNVLRRRGVIGICMDDAQ